MWLMLLKIKGSIYSFKFGIIQFIKYKTEKTGCVKVFYILIFVWSCQLVLCVSFSRKAFHFWTSSLLHGCSNHRNRWSAHRLPNMAWIPNHFSGGCFVLIGQMCCFWHGLIGWPEIRWPISRFVGDLSEINFPVCGRPFSGPYSRGKTREIPRCGSYLWTLLP